MQIHWTKINKVIRESDEIMIYMLDRPDGLAWQEGAHTHLAFEGFNAGEKPDRSLIRHMSIATLPHEDAVAITTRIGPEPSKFKAILKGYGVGDEVAIFKMYSHVPLNRDNRPIYLLSQGVGLATFRPLVLAYLKNTDAIQSMHSLNVAPTSECLFTDVFQPAPDKKFTAQFVDSRASYYRELEALANDQEGIFYVVGSDEFLAQNTAVLQRRGIPAASIMLDKHDHQRPQFVQDELETSAVG